LQAAGLRDLLHPAGRPARARCAAQPFLRLWRGGPPGLAGRGGRDRAGGAGRTGRCGGMSRLPAPLAGLIALVGGAVTGVVLLIGVLSITSATTEQHMLSVASAIVVLPVGLIVLAASVYVAR